MGKQTSLQLLSCQPPSPFHPWTPPQNPQAISWWLWQFHHQKSGRSWVFCLSLHSGFLIPGSPSRRVCFLSVNSSPGLSLLLQFSLWCLKERKTEDKPSCPLALRAVFTHAMQRTHFPSTHVSLQFVHVSSPYPWKSAGKTRVVQNWPSLAYRRYEVLYLCREFVI